MANPAWATGMEHEVPWVGEWWWKDPADEMQRFDRLWLLESVKVTRNPETDRVEVVEYWKSTRYTRLTPMSSGNDDTAPAAASSTSGTAEPSNSSAPAAASTTSGTAAASYSSAPAAASTDEKIDEKIDEMPNKRQKISK